MTARSAAALLVAVLALQLPACVQIGGSPRTGDDIPERTSDIVIGAFNFTESRVLAELYKQALQRRGFEAQVLENVGPREIMGPALEQDQIDLVVEYLGAALAFVDPEAAQTVGSSAEAHEALGEELSKRDVHAFALAPGQNRNEIVVSEDTAREHDLREISDLQAIDDALTFGGPPECPARPLCLQGLEDLYGLSFAGFVPLDSGGPHTVGALRAGDVDVALLFTTNPALAAGDLVVLEDDRELQPAENIVPVARKQVVEERGESFSATIDAVTSNLTNEELRELNSEVDIEHRAPSDVASDWLTVQGIV